MARDTDELLQEALNLPTEARATLADSLLESLDSEVDVDSDEAWREEAVRRVGEIDSGAVQLVSWEEAKKRLHARLQR